MAVVASCRDSNLYAVKPDNDTRPRPCLYLFSVLMQSSASTQSFDRPVPAGPWGWIWILTILAVLTLGGILEIAWRTKGHRPMLQDRPDLWAYHRSRVYSSDGRSLVLLGTSRLHCGLAPTFIREVLPDWKVTQLAVTAGGSAVAALRDLAQDAEFNGVIWCGIRASDMDWVRRSDQRSWIDYFHKRYSPSDWVGLPIRSAWDRLLVLNNPELSLRTTLVEVLKRSRMPRPMAVRFEFDRTRYAQIRAIRWRGPKRKWEQRLREYRRQQDQGPSMDPDVWLSEAMRLETYVDLLRERGGKVIFLRMPSSGVLRDYEEITRPKALFWDRFANATQAQTLHYLDVPALRFFDCPDLSHLDEADAQRFTQALLEELDRRGWL